MTSSPFRLAALLPAVIALLWSAGCQHAAPPPHPTVIVAYGDSITRGYAVPVGQGWVEVLEAHLRASSRTRGIAIFNAGGNGNTSTEGLARLASDVLPHLPGLVLVEFGGNDVVEGRRNVPLDQFERNLREIHTAVTARGGEMVLVTFPPVIDAWHQSGKSPYFLARGGLDHEVERYRQRTRELATELHLRLFDLDYFIRDLIAKDGPKRYILPDGVHLTPYANQRVAEAMEGFLGLKTG